MECLSEQKLSNEKLEEGPEEENQHISMATTNDEERVKDSHNYAHNLLLMDKWVDELVKICAKESEKEKEGFSLPRVGSISYFKSSAKRYDICFRELIRHAKLLDPNLSVLFQKVWYGMGKFVSRLSSDYKFQLLKSAELEDKMKDLLKASQVNVFWKGKDAEASKINSALHRAKSISMEAEYEAAVKRAKELEYENERLRRVIDRFIEGADDIEIEQYAPMPLGKYDETLFPDPLDMNTEGRKSLSRSDSSVSINSTTTCSSRSSYSSTTNSNSNTNTNTNTDTDKESRPNTSNNFSSLGIEIKGRKNRKKSLASLNNFISERDQSLHVFDDNMDLLLADIIKEARRQEHVVTEINNLVEKTDMTSIQLARALLVDENIGAHEDTEEDDEKEGQSLKKQSSQSQKDDKQETGSVGIEKDPDEGNNETTSHKNRNNQHRGESKEETEGKVGGEKKKQMNQEGNAESSVKEKETTAKESFPTKKQKKKRKNVDASIQTEVESQMEIDAAIHKNYVAKFNKENNNMIPKEIVPLLTTYPRSNRIPTLRIVNNRIFQIFMFKLRHDKKQDFQGLARFSMIDATFEFFRSRYGNLETAESKIVQLLHGLQYYASHHKRIRIFANFIGAGPVFYDMRTTNFFMEHLKYLEEHGDLPKKDPPVDKDVLILLKRQKVLEMAQHFFHNLLPDCGIALSHRFESLPGPSDTHVNLDDVLEEVLRSWRNIQESWKEHLKYLFRRNCKVYHMVSEIAYTKELEEKEAKRKVEEEKEAEANRENNNLADEDHDDNPFNNIDNISLSGSSSISSKTSHGEGKTSSSTKSLDDSVVESHDAVLVEVSREYVQKWKERTIFHRETLESYRAKVLRQGKDKKTITPLGGEKEVILLIDEEGIFNVLWRLKYSTVMNEAHKKSNKEKAQIRENMSNRARTIHNDGCRRFLFQIKSKMDQDWLRTWNPKYKRYNYVHRITEENLGRKHSEPYDLSNFVPSDFDENTFLNLMFDHEVLAESPLLKFFDKDPVELWPNAEVILTQIAEGSINLRSNILVEQKAFNLNPELILRPKFKNMCNRADDNNNDDADDNNNDEDTFDGVQHPQKRTAAPVS